VLFLGESSPFFSWPLTKFFLRCFLYASLSYFPVGFSLVGGAEFKEGRLKRVDDFWLSGEPFSF